MSQITIACLELAGTTVAEDGDGAATPLLGAVETMVALRAAGIRICVTSDFAPPARDAVLDALGWRPLIDLALSPADAGRGRPWPDLPLAALLRLGGGAVSELAVVGDTAGAVESGLRAGAGLVAGVLTGSASREELAAAGAPHILDAVTGLLALLGLGTPEPALMRPRAAPGDSPG
jgi:phosphoglycolate phosphatase